MSFGRSNNRNSFGNKSSAKVKDIAIQAGLTDGVSCMKFSPAQNQCILVAGCWDGKVKVYNVQKTANMGQAPQFQGAPQVPEMQHPAPVLSTCFSQDGSMVFSGSCDKTAKMWTLGNPQDPGTQVAAVR